MSTYALGFSADVPNYMIGQSSLVIVGVDFLSHIAEHLKSSTHCRLVNI